MPFFRIPFKFKHAFHVNPPNIAHLSSVGNVPIAEHLRHPDLGTIGGRTLLPGLGLSDSVNSLFRTDIVKGQSMMLIPNDSAFRDYSLFKPRFSQRFTDAYPLPGLEILGCGYNVFGAYAETSSLKRFLFDIAKMPPLVTRVIEGVAYTHWPIVTCFPLSSSNRQAASGQTAIEYSNSLRANAGISGGWGGFHGEVETCFTKSQRQSIYRAFTSVSDTISLWSLRLNDIDNMRDYLTDEALNAIDHWEPDRLFDEFGLYFLTGIIMGGKLDLWSSVDMFKLDSSTDLSISAKASYFGFVDGNGSYSSSESYATFTQNSESSFATIGGDATKGGESIKDQQSYQAWKDTIKSQPAFIDFTRPTDKRPLTPIWQLALGTRRDQLAKYSEVYAKKISDGWIDMNRIDPNSARKSVTYVVTTFTGKQGGAGTDSNIDMQLYGTDRLGQTQILSRRPHDDGRDNHNKGAIDDITYPSVHDLGEINKITFYHKSKGDRPAWLLDKVEVRCNESGKRWGTSFNGWIKDKSVALELLPLN